MANVEKLHSYQGWTGRFHEWRDDARRRYTNWREENRDQNIVDLAKDYARKVSTADVKTDGDYSHIYRKKSRMELVRISAAVMGIEFSYACETAFVSPTLLKIGVPHQHMTLVWALSPLVGFFLTPLLGSCSDRCRLPLGRRRPFIILLSIGVFLGLLLVPNGEDLGYAMGDFYPYDIFYNDTATNGTITKILPHRTTAQESEIEEVFRAPNSHPWGVFFTILGTVLLDFDADSCQSPARAYLLDVTVPDDHARGLSTFTIMAGLGGFMGYSLGGINWDATSIGVALGGHVRAVFTLITVIFIICVAATITAFNEIPLSHLEASAHVIPDYVNEENMEKGSLDETSEPKEGTNRSETNPFYGSIVDPEKQRRDSQKKRMELLLPKEEYTVLPGENVAETSFTNQAHMNNVPHPIQEEGVASLSHYLLSIIFMPRSLRMLCLTNLFSWSAHVCYSLYFTDYVGEAVFEGDPKAPYKSLRYDLYEEGVRFGCFGMAMYSLSCSCYSLIIERLIARYRAKRVYVGGLLFYSAGMFLMALCKSKVGVIFFSWAAGVMYSTLFTMPYLLVAHYHAQGVFELTDTGESKLGTEHRGLGTDIAVVSSMVFLAQFILSVCMGTIVSWSGTTSAVVTVASLLGFCGAISATQVMYLDL